MQLDQIAPLASLHKGSPAGRTLKGITSNSRHVQPDFLFIAERGVTNDGHAYIPAAIMNGASALLVEDVDAVPSQYQGVVYVAKNTRAIAPQIANLFYEKPSEKLFCVGVTGTNGKTSLTYLVEHLFNSAHYPTGVIGTINHHLGSRVWSTEMTTPHPIELQERLKNFVDAGAKALAIEVSSHALDQRRIESIEFDVGIFTNLTRDHLDYHSTMEEYFRVKERFFSEILEQSSKPKTFSIINKDDPWGSKIQTGARSQRWSYGRANADFTFQVEKMDFQGNTFKLNSPMGPLHILSPLLGLHNVYNVMAAVATALAGGLSISQIEDAIKDFAGIPGRLQMVPNHRGLLVVVDYAHSPDALENVLLSLKKVREEQSSQGKIICVFGCGGDRDKGKRPLMAAVAEKLADVSIVTSDNPRTEDPQQILRDIIAGFSLQAQPIVEVDRSKAINLAIELAKPDDIILIAGKGHEDYQIIGKEKFYFSDYETARKLLL